MKMKTAPGWGLTSEWVQGGEWEKGEKRAKGEGGSRPQTHAPWNRDHESIYGNEV